MTGWIEFSSMVMTFVLVGLFLTIFVLALIGVQKICDDRKELKWQREYGKKLQEETERNQWTNMERLRDTIFLLEELIKDKGIQSSMHSIDRIISQVDYDARYNAWKKNEAKWELLALSSMAGGFGSTEKTQVDINENFVKYEEQRKRELRGKLNRGN